MIKGITGGRYVLVSGGTSDNPYISPGSVGAGMMRYNPNMNCMEVSDGNVWKTLGISYATVALNAEAESLLDWAKQERDRQLTRQQRSQTNPALRKALEAIQRAEENYDLLDRIVADDV